MTSFVSLLLLAVVVLSYDQAVEGKLRAGGLGEAKPANADAREVANAVTVKQGILRQLQSTNTPQNEYEVVSYATQVVAGTNYFLKIKINSRPPAYIHARVWGKIDGTYEVSSVETGHTATDPIAYF